MSTRSPAVTADPDAPVVIRFPALGDAVLLTPLLAALGHRHGRPVHLLSSGAWTPVLLGHDPAVGELRLLSSRRAPYWLTPSQWRAVPWLRAHRGPVYLCERDEHAARLLSRARVPESRVVRAWDHHPGDAIHWVDWWLQVAALDAPGCPAPTAPATTPPPPRPRLRVPARWQDDTDDWLRSQGLWGCPLVLLQPGHKKTHKRGRLATQGHDKHWPDGHWAQVISGVLADQPASVVLVCGSPRERGLVQTIVETAGRLRPGAAERVRNVAADCPLPRLVGLAVRAHSMISVDTGPAHVAGAMDCPLVVLYGRFGWQRWLPRPATAAVVPLGPRLPSERARLLDITPDEVLAAWRGLPARRPMMGSGQVAGPASAPVAAMSLPSCPFVANDSGGLRAPEGG